MVKAILWVVGVLVALTVVGNVLTAAQKAGKSNTAPAAAAPAPKPKPAQQAAAQQPEPEPKKGPDVDASPEAQAKREQLIQRLQEMKIVHRTEVGTGGTARVYVMPAFYALPVEQKSSFCNMILAFFRAQDRRFDMLRIIDHRSGQTVGSFSVKPWSPGLTMDVASPP